MSNSYPFITFNEAYKLVKHALSRQSSIMLHASPSAGKTAIGNKLAKEINLKPIVFSLMDHEPTDLCGLPDLSGGKATFKPFDTFPIEGDELPEGKAGWLIMLDEYTSGTRALQSAANKLIYERLVGDKPLHPKAFVICMGNLATDNCFVNEMPMHAKSRQIHLYVRQDVHEWVDWAIKAGVDRRVVSYVMSKPSTITKYDPEYIGINYPCARTMEELSKQVKGLGSIDRYLVPLIQGTIGQGPGLEFYNFSRLEDSLPTIKDIVASPLTATVPAEMGHKFALAGILSEGFTIDNAGPIMQYLERLPRDATYLVVKMAVTANPKLLGAPAIDNWVTTNSRYFYK